MYRQSDDSIVITTIGGSTKRCCSTVRVMITMYVEVSSADIPFRLISYQQCLRQLVTTNLKGTFLTTTACRYAFVLRYDTLVSSFCFRVHQSHMSSMFRWLAVCVVRVETFFYPFTCSTPSVHVETSS